MTKVWSSMKRFKLQIAAMTDFKDFWRENLPSLFSLFGRLFVSASNFHHDLELSSFYDGMRNQKFTKFCDSNNGTVPSPDRFSNDIGAFIGWNRPDNSSYSFFKPIKKYYFRIRDGYVSLINSAFAIFIPCDWFRDVNSPFSVHNAREISDLMLREDSPKKVCHRTPILNVYGEL